MRYNHLKLVRNHPAGPVFALICTISVKSVFVIICTISVKCIFCLNLNNKNMLWMLERNKLQNLSQIIWLLLIDVRACTSQAHNILGFFKGVYTNMGVHTNAAHSTCSTQYTCTRTCRSMGSTRNVQLQYYWYYYNCYYYDS